MKILCASSLTHGEAVFSSVGDVTILPESDITADVARGFDALAIRSKTVVTDAYFENDSQLRFVGTATAGVDHLQGRPADPSICIASAGGCNANSVAEYVVAALLELEHETGKSLDGLTLGIVGHGHVGKAVERRVQALGIRCLLNDPPLADRSTETDYLPLEELLRQSNILTLHVPLVEEGLWPTRSFITEKHLNMLPRGAWLINACRGEVLDGPAVQRCCDSGDLAEVVLDVWDPEPEWPLELQRVVRFGSAHIAGHSYEGKWNGTLLVYQQMVKHFGINDESESLDETYRPRQNEIDCSGLGIRDVVRLVYAIRDDDRLLRELADLAPSDRAMGFNQLRRSYRHRPEFRNTRVIRCAPDLARCLATLGFSVSDY